MTPLNPARFGKLVHLIFPGIQIRELGKRGETRRYYMNLALIDDQPEGQGSKHVQRIGDRVGAGGNLVDGR